MKSFGVQNDTFGPVLGHTESIRVWDLERFGLLTKHMFFDFSRPLFLWVWDYRKGCLSPQNVSGFDIPIRSKKGSLFVRTFHHGSMSDSFKESAG